MNTQTGGATAATDTNPAAVHDGGYIHREIAPRDRRDIPPPPPPPRSCRTVMLSFREADFAARPPCYR